MLVSACLKVRLRSQRQSYIFRRSPTFLTFLFNRAKILFFVKEALPVRIGGNLTLVKYVAVVSLDGNKKIDKYVIYSYTRMHIRTHARTHTHTHARTHAHSRTHTHARTHTHTRIHTHMHTHTYTDARAHTHLSLIHI